MYMAGLNELIEKVGSGVSKAAAAAQNITGMAVSKVGNLTQEAKIRYAMHEIEDRMCKNYAAIGEAVYLSYKNDEDMQDFSEYIGHLDALKDEMEALKKRLKEECNLCICQDCDTLVKKNDSFCPKCGAKMKDERI